MMKPRRLRGHKATATCCVASGQRAGLIVTSAEDGCICWFDIRCKDVLYIMDVAKTPISSLCFNPGNEDVLYVSSVTEVKCLDVHMAGSWKPLESYNYNKEEINQIACNSKSSFLATADDGGDVKIIDIRQKCLYKTLKSGHTSICSSVQFIPWKPWEVITGGLDSRIVIWDFSKGRPYKLVDFASTPEKDSTSSGGQCFNPAFVHSIAVPDDDMLERTDRVCVVARGDGVADIINIDSELVANKSKGSLKLRKESRRKDGVSTGSNENSDENRRKRLHLDHSLGGHTAAVSCVAFSIFGEKGKFIISGGNDKSVKVWDWSGYLSDTDPSCKNTDILRLNIELSKKVNWLCTTPTDSENLVVCDTSKVVKIYSVS